jgi:modulator of FtsH protease
MAETQFVTADRQAAVATTNKVLRNTYMLLSMTLMFSAMMAGVSIAFNVPHIGLIPWLIVTFGLLFAVNKLKNSAWGILMVFLFTGFLGLSIGPIVSYYMASTGGSQIVMTALGMTGFIFFALSGYVLTTKKDMSFMGGFLFTGLMVVVGAIVLMFVGGFFGLHIPGLHLAISAAVVLLMSGFILFDTSRIIHGGETNYLMATVSLYLSIYNIFTSLLHLLGAVDD